MTRTVLFAMVVALAVAALGCGKKPAAPVDSGKPSATIPGAIDFEKLWPKEEVAKLTPDQRARLLELALVGLKGNNWQHAREVLVALGKDAIAPLINLVDSEEPSAAAGTQPLTVMKVKAVGELAHDTLLELVRYRSSYKGALPLRNKDAWNRWWTDNRSSLVIND